MAQTTEYEQVLPVVNREHEPSQPKHEPGTGHDHNHNHNREPDDGQFLDQSSPLGSAKPHTLDRTATDIVILAAVDLLMVLAWNGMLIYALLVWYARDNFVDEMSLSAVELIGAATTQVNFRSFSYARPIIFSLSTIFSILFAASLSRALGSLALWLLERGSTIGLLDQLVGNPVNIKSFDDYSSLFGLPVEQYGYSSGQTFDFTVESWYWDFACSRWSHPPEYSDVFEGLQFNASYIGINGYGSGASIYYNLTGMYGDSDYRVTRPKCISAFPHLADDDTAECSELSARRFAVSTTYFHSYCDISTEHVETQIVCAEAACSPRRIRQSRQPHPKRNWTIFDAQRVGSAISAEGAVLTNQGSFWDNFAHVLVDRAGSLVDPLLKYIANPAQTFFASGQGDLRNGASTNVRRPEIDTVEDSLITLRFSQVVNSYYVACVGSMLVTGSDDTWKKTSETDRNLTAKYDGLFTNATTSTAITVMTPRQKFQCSLPWLLIFTTVTLLSLISAVIGLIFTLQIRGPRLAMTVTTMLRDDLHSNLGQNASYMDDDHRSRKTRETRARIGDVAPDKDIGHIAIATIAGDGSTEVDGLGKGRLYQ